ncbi:MAG TPA: transposase, partial [Trueperaceae bacterium]
MSAPKPNDALPPWKLSRNETDPGACTLSADEHPEGGGETRLLLAEPGEMRRFGSARKLVAFAGLTCRRYESGTSVRRSRFSRL